MIYNDLLQECDNKGLEVKEKKFKSSAKGLCKGSVIGISTSLTTPEKKCVLAEEIGHYETTTGDIINLTDTGNRKQEITALRWAIDYLIKPDDLIRGFNNGARNMHEMAAFLDVSEEFLHEAINYFSLKYRTHKKGKVTINFSPFFIYRTG